MITGSPTSGGIMIPTPGALCKDSRDRANTLDQHATGSGTRTLGP